jgi:hypothetical protein
MRILRLLALLLTLTGASALAQSEGNCSASGGIAH